MTRQSLLFAARASIALFSCLLGNAGEAKAQTWWNPDAMPSSPHAQDDEFDGNSTASWNDWDFAGYVTETIDATREMLKLVGTGNGTDRLAGKYQALPASEFAIYVKFAAVTPAVTGVDPCIFLAQDATSSTGDVRTLSAKPARSTATGAYFASWTAYNGWSTHVDMPQVTPVRYMRLRVNGTTYFADVSADGVTWVQGSTGAIGFTPLYWGIAADFFQNGVTSSVYFDFVRVFSGTGTSAADATFIGRLM